MKEKLYKILVDGKSCHGGNLKWSLPVKKNGKWTPGEWHEEDQMEICKTGLHLTTKPYNWYKWGCTNYEVEPEGALVWKDDKCVAMKVRLLKEVPHPKWWTDCEGWVATLKNIAWLKPDGKPKKEWKLFETRDAARDATLNAARDATLNAAWVATLNAAWVAAGVAARDAAWVAAGVAARVAARDAARDAALNAAGVAAWDAAGDAALNAAGDAAWVATLNAALNAAGVAAGDAAWDAAGDAAIYSRVTFICDGLKLESKHRIHVRKRMEVWQKGYGLWEDINGVLYCYKKI